MDFYWYPNCSTCKKAMKWLDQKGREYRTIHIVDNPPSKQELAVIAEKSGLPIRKLFNTAGKKYREAGLKDKLGQADEDQMLEWLSSDGMLIKRPIAIDGEKATVGFKEEMYEKTWN